MSEVMMSSLLSGFGGGTVGLRFGDSISLVVNDLDAVVVGLQYQCTFDQGTCCVQVLKEGVAVPPNVDDCRFDLLPPRQFSETKNLNKLVKDLPSDLSKAWADGKGLSAQGMKDVVRGRFDAAARSFIEAKQQELKEQSLEESFEIIKEVCIAQKMASEETIANDRDEQRQLGKQICYGEGVVLRHHQSQLFLTLSKLPAQEPGARMVCLTGAASQDSNFQVSPANKTISGGYAVMSGDLVMLQARKAAPDGQHLMLNMCELQVDSAELRAMTTHSRDLITGFQELNGSLSLPATCFRALFFGHFAERSRADCILNAQDAVCFYHKDSLSFLSFDPYHLHKATASESLVSPSVQTSPASLCADDRMCRSASSAASVGSDDQCHSRVMSVHMSGASSGEVVKGLLGFYQSNRTGMSDRRKSSWMWKIESNSLHGAGASVRADEARYRIKHLATNTYLTQRGACLACTKDMQDPGTLFSLRVWRGEKDSAQVLTTDLVFLRGRSGDYLSNDAQVLGAGGGSGGGGGGGGGNKRKQQVRWQGAHFLSGHTDLSNLAPFALLPVHKAVLRPLTRLHCRLVPDLRYFLAALERLPDVHTSGAVGSVRSIGQGQCDSTAASSSMAGSSQDLSADDAVELLLETCDAWYASVSECLTTLILSCTKGSESNPFVKDGPPNKVMQKTLREADGIPILLHLIGTTFHKGIAYLCSKGQSLNTTTGLQRIVQVINLCFRLLRQMVKLNDANAHILFWFWQNDPDYSPRNFLGLGLNATPCIEELFRNRHDLILQFQRADIDLIISLIKIKRAPQYVAILTSLCSCHDQPMSEAQEMICNALLEREARLLPRCMWQAGTLFFYISDGPAPAHAAGKPPSVAGEEGVWVDISSFNNRTSAIMTKPLNDLSDEEQKFKYFVGCTQLYHKLAGGRNQRVQELLVRDPQFALSFDVVYSVMKAENLPNLTRALYTNLMCSLYIDRAPAAYVPQVKYTRIWNQAGALDKDGSGSVSLAELRDAMQAVDPNVTEDAVKARFEAMDADKDGQVSRSAFSELLESFKRLDLVPKVKADNIQQVMRFLLNELPKMGGAMSPENEGHSLKDIRGVQYSNIELLSAQINLANEMLDYGFWHVKHDDESSDLSTASQLLQILYDIVDPGGKPQTECHSIEAVMLHELRSFTLKLMVRVINLRTDQRITLAVRAYEEIFNKMSERGQLQSGCEELDFPFEQYGDKMHDLQHRMLHTPILSCGKFLSDTYLAGDHKRDKARHELCRNQMVRVMLEASCFRDAELKTQAVSLLMRNLTQRSRCLSTLQLVQILVTDQAREAYHLCQSFMHHISILKKQISMDSMPAQVHATLLIAALQRLITQDPQTSRDMVQQNQRIMLHLGVERSVVSLLQLPLPRDRSRRDQGLFGPDRAFNSARRQLFQTCYNLLGAMSDHYPEAQVKLFELFDVLFEHCGIESLNTASTLSSIFKDNPMLLQIHGHHISSTIEAVFGVIKTFGRQWQWLELLTSFLQVAGNPVKKHQQHILRLLVENKDLALDFTCDYTASVDNVNAAFICAQDPRLGLSRIDLMRASMHKLDDLLCYHASSIQILAMCAAGKNRFSQFEIIPMLSPEQVLDSVLFLDMQADGTRACDIDKDVLRFVKRSWLNLLAEVFFSSNDEVVRKSVETAMLRCDDLSPQLNADIELSENEGERKQTGWASILQEWSTTLQTLCVRLRAVKAENGWVPSCLSQLAGLSDEHGSNLLQHFEYAISCVKAAIFFHRFASSRKRFYECLREQKHTHNSQKLALAAVQLLELIQAVQLLELIQELRALETSLMELLSVMSHGGFSHSSLRANSLQMPESLATEAPRVQTFLLGWSRFLEYFGAQIVAPPEGARQWTSQVDAEIFDLAQMYGSTNTYCNETFQALRQLVIMLSSKEDNSAIDDPMRLTGLKIMRAILFISPDLRDNDEQLHEYQQLLDKKPPSPLSRSKLVQLQDDMTRIGYVHAVTYNLTRSRSPVIISAALQLAVTLTEGGNQNVQSSFIGHLTKENSQEFFDTLMSLFDRATMLVKKRRRIRKEALRVAGAQDKSSVSLQNKTNGSQDEVDMSVVFMFLRRLCTGQNTQLQNLLHTQPSNAVSYCFLNLAYQYLEALEPTLVAAINHADWDTIDNAVRGFRMLKHAIEGPNATNIEALASTGIFDLSDRIFARLNYDIAIYNSPNPLEPAQVLDRHKGNLRKCELKSAVTGLLRGFMVGTSGGLATQKLLFTLDWYILASQMQHSYTTLTQCLQKREYLRLEDHLVETKTVTERLSVKCRQEAEDYYMLIKQCQPFDNGSDLGRMMLEQPKDMLLYFEQRTGYVEIARDGNLEAIYFPFSEDMLKGQSLDKPFQEMFNTEREDLEEKNVQWLQHMTILVDKITHETELRNGPLAFTVTMWERICSLSLWMAFIIHLLLVLGGTGYEQEAEPDARRSASKGGSTASEGGSTAFGGGAGGSGAGGDDVKETLAGLPTPQDSIFSSKVEPVVEIISIVLCVMHLVVCGVRLFSFVSAVLPYIVLCRRKADEESEVPSRDVKEEGNIFQFKYTQQEQLFCDEQGEELEDSDQEDNIEHGDEDVPEKQDENSSTQLLSFGGSTLWIVASSPAAVYELLFFVFALLAVALQEPLMTTFSLFEICFWPGCKSVVDALLVNGGKMARTMLMGILCAHVWMVFGMKVFSSAHETCDTYLQCVLSYLYYAIRNNGVTEMIDTPGEDFPFPRNIADALVHPDGQYSFAVRMIWDISFQVLFLYVLLSIITGIVIDGFAVLRDEHDAAKADLESFCFVCGLSKLHLERTGTDFTQHIKRVHNARWYIFFLVYLKRKMETVGAELTVQEQFVADLVWPSSLHGRLSTEWLPRLATVSKSEIEPEDETSTNINRLCGTIEELKTSIAQLETQLAFATADQSRLPV